MTEKDEVKTIDELHIIGSFVACFFFPKCDGILISFESGILMLCVHVFKGFFVGNTPF